MAEKVSNVLDGWSKWQVAVAVGAPIALGLAGLWLYKRRSPRTSPTVDEKVQNKEKKPESEPLVTKSKQDQAQAAKAKGNKYFKGGKYEQAITCYTEAIELCPKEHTSDIATFYQNRAAAHEQLKLLDKVIEDCSKALEYNNKYAKALFRRAKAYETTNDLMACLEDVTAVCIVENFQNQQSLLMADRVLKELGRSKAKEAIKNRAPIEPSRQFVRTYFSAFCNDPIFHGTEKPAAGAKRDAGSPDSAHSSDSSEPEKHTDETPEKEMIGDGENVVGVDATTATEPARDDQRPNGDADIETTSCYQRARSHLLAGEYKPVVGLCTQELAAGEKSTHRAETLLLRGTMYLLSGEGTKAQADFDMLLNMDGVDKRIRSNALIKRGSLRMQHGGKEGAIADFAQAQAEDAENSDIYHHQGQLNLLVERVDEAVDNFKKSVELSPDFPVAHVQKCYTEYRRVIAQQMPPSQMNKVLQDFEKTIAEYPNCAEGYALYGQAMCDQQNFEKADESFKKALKLEPDNGNLYVHRGLLRLQWKQDIEEASSLISKALDIDSKCEFAYETLGTIEVQRGNLAKAIDLFNKAIELAKTEVEMAHLFSLLDAAIAQSRVATRYGIAVPT